MTVRNTRLFRLFLYMKNVCTSLVIALLLLIAQPADAEVGGTITRQASTPTTINTIVMAVLDLFTWESPVGTIDFSDGRYMANAGCNNISGTYIVDGTIIDFGEVVSTLMYCEGKMDTEAALNNTLAKSATFSFIDGALVLSHSTSSTRFIPTLTTTQK
jgi:heat shock protein HslJ